ncbi:MAG: rubrerythrin family protein [Vampirovibrionales bacterium]|nr:rubrerythrin family protein [Vampirovibrionales bacterium]
MPELKGSQTEKNLLKAFAGESQARNRYTYFSSQAKKEGLIQIAAVFEETANHEREHAKRFFKFLQGGMLEITATFPAGIIGSTADNLRAAAAGEHEEWEILYPGFAQCARDEGFSGIATVFDSICRAEQFHERRYLALLENVIEQSVFKKAQPVQWRCRNCGLIHEGPEAPGACPACAHPQAHFELWEHNWL